MKTNKFSLRHHGRVGVGGWHCACCGIPPRLRKQAARLHKKRLYRQLDRIDNASETPQK